MKHGAHRGKDGEISGRRVWGSILLFLGCGLEIAGQFQPGDAVRFYGGIVLLCFGSLFWGLITIQNIVDMVKKE